MGLDVLVHHALELICLSHQDDIDDTELPHHKLCIWSVRGETMNTKEIHVIFTNFTR